MVLKNSSSGKTEFRSNFRYSYHLGRAVNDSPLCSIACDCHPRSFHHATVSKYSSMRISKSRMANTSVCHPDFLIDPQSSPLAQNVPQKQSILFFSPPAITAILLFTGNVQQSRQSLPPITCGGIAAVSCLTRVLPLLPENPPAFLSFSLYFGYPFQSYPL